MSQKRKNIKWKDWRYKYRFVILNSDTFEERLAFTLSKLNLFVLCCFSLLLLIGGTSLIIATTSLKEYIPGYASSNMRRNVVALSHLSDSLLVTIEQNILYINNLKAIINGGEPLEKKHLQDLGFEKNTPPSFETVLADSVLRNQIEDEERFSLFSSDGRKNSLQNELFFTPLKGVLTQSFDARLKHFGVDVVAKKNSPIKCILDGVVVFASWTAETGHVIAVLHESGVFSIYKHNSVLLKKEGDTVLAGEVVAIIGNSGKFSSGPHLHFELWHNNKPINPESYIIF